jgi:hypothetical protein
MHEACKQYDILDTIFNDMFCLGTPRKHLYLSPQTHYEAGRHIVGFIDFYRCFPGGPKYKSI